MAGFGVEVAVAGAVAGAGASAAACSARRMKALSRATGVVGGDRPVSVSTFMIVSGEVSEAKPKHVGIVWQTCVCGRSNGGNLKP